MVLSWIPHSGKSGMGMGVDPRSPANPTGMGRGWEWTPDPRRAGDRGSIPDPRQIGDGDGDGDRGFRALSGANRPPPEGVECRLGSSIIKTASPKKKASSDVLGGGSGNCGKYPLRSPHASTKPLQSLTAFLGPPRRGGTAPLRRGPLPVQLPLLFVVGPF